MKNWEGDLEEKKFLRFDIIIVKYIIIYYHS